MEAESLMSITRTFLEEKLRGGGVRYGFRGIFTGRRPTFFSLSFVYLKKMATIRQSSGAGERYVWMEIPHTHCMHGNEAKRKRRYVWIACAWHTRTHVRTWLALGGTHR